MHKTHIQVCRNYFPQTQFMFYLVVLLILLLKVMQAKIGIEIMTMGSV